MAQIKVIALAFQTFGAEYMLYFVTFLPNAKTLRGDASLFVGKNSFTTHFTMEYAGLCTQCTFYMT